MAKFLKAIKFRKKKIHNYNFNFTKIFNLTMSFNVFLQWDFVSKQPKKECLFTIGRLFHGQRFSYKVSIRASSVYLKGLKTMIIQFKKPLH